LADDVNHIPIINLVKD